MKTEIDTRKVTGRRKLRFKGMDDIAVDVEQLARAKELKALGNWSAGQVLKHLAISVNNSVDGFPPMLPGFVRFGVRLLMKNKVLYGEPSPGFRLPKKGASMLPPPTSVEDGFKSLREALQHFRTETERLASCNRVFDSGGVGTIPLPALGNALELPGAGFRMKPREFQLIVQ